MTVSADDIAAAGRAIYNEKIRHLVEPTKKATMVLIDVNSGDYEIGGHGATALATLKERHPDAVVWAELVGYPDLPPIDLKRPRYVDPDDLAELVEIIKQEYPQYDQG